MGEDRGDGEGMPMSQEESLERHLEQPPALEHARRASVMAHSIVIKLKEMGLPDEMDEDLSQFCTDLGDLWSAQTTLVSQVEKFLKTPHDSDAAGDHLVDLRATIDHMAWHMKAIGRPMDNITNWAYSQSEA